MKKMKRKENANAKIKNYMRINSLLNKFFFGSLSFILVEFFLKVDSLLLIDEIIKKGFFLYRKCLVLLCPDFWLKI